MVLLWIRNLHRKAQSFQISDFDADIKRPTAWSRLTQINAVGRQGWFWGGSSGARS
jgi:hypothetical protein